MDVTRLLLIIQFSLGYGLGKGNFWAGFYMLLFLSVFVGMTEFLINDMEG